MLQINSGKLFTRGIERTNRLTGVLYSNARLPHDCEVVTDAGTLRPTGSKPSDLAIIYEIDERIEYGPDGPGVLVSHGNGPYLDDFAVVATFGLGAIFSREPETVRLLTDGRAALPADYPPAKFIRRVYEPTLFLDHDAVERFRTFVTKLLALERRSFLGAMQAMRTFVSGLHRIYDNPGQSYTMMVSAAESLAQDFDKFVPTWTDLSDDKRKAVDAALEPIAQVSAAAIRSAILSHEHVAVARRYRAFVLAHIDHEFFREPTENAWPLARYELEEAVKAAYNIRSAHLHRLQPLPTPIAHPHEHWESTTVERKPALSFQGLYRVTRHVITSFVERQPKVEHEAYNYSLERAGVIQMQWAAYIWIGRPISRPDEVRRRLEGLIECVAQIWAREPDAKFVDLRPALADVERLLPQASPKYRPAMLSLYFLFNLVVAEDLRSTGFQAFFERFAEEANQPAVDNLVVSTMLDAVEDWTIDTYRKLLDEYFVQRLQRSSLHAPRLIEAAMCLTLAEKYRQLGDSARAQEEILRAFETHPGCAALRKLIQEDVPEEINWRSILLPKAPHEPADEAGAAPQ